MKITNRRAFVSGLMAAPAAGLALQSSPAAAATMTVPGYKPELVPAKEEVWGWLIKMQEDFGPRRMCGDDNHINFVNWLEERFKALGCTTQRDHYTLKHWDADMRSDTNASLTVGGTTTNLDVLSFFPYSGSTKESGPATGKLIYLPVQEPGAAAKAAEALAAAPPADLANSVVAIECPCPLKFNGPVPPVLYGAFPANLIPTGLEKNPVNNDFAGLDGVYNALDGKCKGILFCWTDVSDDAARYQWMPFGQPHHKTPGLWVGRDTALLLKDAAKSGGTISMELRATITPDRPTDGLIATLPGMTSEIVTIGTHTDGVNLNEENGAVALMSLATYAAALPRSQRKRTLVFVLATGHMASGPLRDKETSTGPNGQRGAGADGAGFFRDHPEIVSRTVAAIAAEHLGAMEWVDDADGRNYHPTGLPTKDLWYIGSEATGSKVPDAAAAVMANATLAAAQGSPEHLLRMEVTKEGKSSPESSPAIRAGIPAMGLIPLPSCLLEASPSGAIERINRDVLYNQVQVLTKLMVIIDKLSTDELHAKVPVDSAMLNAAAPRANVKTAEAGKQVHADLTLPALMVASLLGLRLRKKEGEA